MRGCALARTSWRRHSKTQKRLRLLSVFAPLPKEDRERFFTELSGTSDLAAVPDRDLANPGRHAQKVSAQAANALDRESEIRSRSVAIGREGVKDEAVLQAVLAAEDQFDADQPQQAAGG